MEVLQTYSYLGGDWNRQKDGLWIEIIIWNMIGWNTPISDVSGCDGLQYHVMGCYGLDPFLQILVSPY